MNTNWMNKEVIWSLFYEVLQLLIIQQTPMNWNCFWLVRNWIIKPLSENCCWFIYLSVFRWALKDVDEGWRITTALLLIRPLSKGWTVFARQQKNKYNGLSNPHSWIMKFVHCSIVVVYCEVVGGVLSMPRSLPVCKTIQCHGMRLYLHHSAFASRCMYPTYCPCKNNFSGKLL